MLVDLNQCLLLVVDVQEKLIEKIHKKDNLISNIRKVLDVFNALSLPIIITEQYPKGLGRTTELITKNQYSYKIIDKTTFSCLADNEFRRLLNTYKKNQIVICGIETHICVLQTAFDLKKNKNQVFILADSVSSRNKESHELALRRFNLNAISVLNTEMLIFELLRDSKHSNFRELSSLIK
ncbi:hydrolase [Rickettsiales bacterium]|nr:hydrolase [Rickettsiales bacterium]